MVRTDIVSVIVQWYDNWFSSTVQWYSAWYGDIVIFAAGQYRTVQYHNSATCTVYDSVCAIVLCNLLCCSAAVYVVCALSYNLYNHGEPWRDGLSTGQLMVIADRADSWLR